MITIEGKSVKPGVAIATAAVVDAKQGLSGVSPALMMEGVKALRAMELPRDYPEAVVACDMLALGVSLKIPGVTTIGIACESDAEVPGLVPEVPCVIGLTDLIKSISEGDVLIVDGDRGVVHIDPDLETILRYQDMEERAAHEHVVYIAAEHLPAKTPDGEIVNVFAHVRDESGLATALEQGADGVVVDAISWPDDSDSPFSMALHMAAGKPVAFAIESAMEDLLRAAAEYAAPKQVTMLFPAKLLDDLLAETSALLDMVAEEALREDLEPPQIAFGAFARDVELPQVVLGERVLSVLLDVSRSPALDRENGLKSEVARWTHAAGVEQTVLFMGKRVDVVARVVEAGARAIAVEPELVAAAKDAIRSMAEGDIDMQGRDC